MGEEDEETKRRKKEFVEEVRKLSHKEPSQWEWMVMWKSYDFYRLNASSVPSILREYFLTKEQARHYPIHRKATPEDVEEGMKKYGFVGKKKEKKNDFQRNEKADNLHA